MTSMEAANELRPQVLEADVLVVGSGAAGCGAALAAIDHGATVTLLEKQDVNGGSAMYSAGGFWTFKEFETFERLAPLGDRELQAKLYDSHHGAAAFIKNTGVYVSEEPIPTNNKGGHGYKIDIAGLAQRTLEIVEDTGGSVLLETAARELLWDGQRATGVIAQRNDGTAIRINARAVVLATGGFQGSPEMLARYMGENSDKLLLRSNPGSVGDGFRMATDVGAAGTRGMSSFYGHLISHPTTSFSKDDFRPLTQYHSAHSLLLNRKGERFIDETLGDSTLSQALLRQPEALGVLIFDDHVRGTEATDEPFPGVGQVDRYTHAVSKGARHAQSNTLSGLLDQVSTWGLDRAKLERSVEEYTNAIRLNASYVEGIPIGKDARAPETAPFYAVEVQPAITFTFGGIRISPEGRALDHDSRPIPGLYAAGADIGGISNIGYAGGLAPCFITGTWAGRAAGGQVTKFQRETPVKTTT